jgi:hypothetical protein
VIKRQGTLADSKRQAATQLGHSLSVSCPPFIEDGIVWHVVRRANGKTAWRRLFLKSSPSLLGAQRRRIKHDERHKDHDNGYDQV